jgi:N-acetylmuramoyl-L-alanine amidase
MRTFNDTIRRVMYWGHARNDLWLTVSQSGGGVGKPAADEVIEAADIAAFADAKGRDGKKMRLRFPVLGGRKHQFVGCNSKAFAEEWSTKIRVWSQGVDGIINFDKIHSGTGGGVPRLTTGATIHTYDNNGKETATGSTWGSRKRHARRPLVVLDPGHGGADAAGGSSPYGARGSHGTLEKDVTLATARQVASHIGSDVDVMITRHGDSNMSLGRRAEIGHAHDADAFVSIHADDAPGAWVHPDAPSRSAMLAQGIHAQLEGYGARNLATGNLAVIDPHAHRTRTAACLVDVGSVGEPGVERRLRDHAQRDEVARAIAYGIRGYLMQSHLLRS